MGNNFFLFDIDGVLLKPGGYRKAAQDTLIYFLESFGFSGPVIDHNNFELFESMEITSEWDMIPLYLLACLESFFHTNKLNHRIFSTEALISFVQNNRGEAPNPKKKISDFKALIEDGKSKADCVLEKKNSLIFIQSFPIIYQNANWLIDYLLKDASNPLNSRTIQYFQNLIIGEKLFEDIYQFQAQVKTDSYLLLYDQNNLEDEIRTILLSLLKDKKIFGSAMTARPTSIPKKNDLKNNVYFPEGEIGLSTVMLPQIPVIGFGQLTYLSSIVGGSGEAYLKPSPIHALTAILASVGFSGEEAVYFAYELILNKNQVNHDLLSDLFSEPFSIHIFEDATGGIRSVKNLMKWLNGLGFFGEVYLYGITQNRIKAEALKNENAAIYSDINAALSKGVGLVKN